VRPRWRLSYERLRNQSHRTRSGISIKNVDELHRAIGQYLIANRKRLSGKEVRFLRRELDYTQSELARYLGASAQQVARYEKDGKISGASDRILRLLCKEHFQRNVSIKGSLQNFDAMDDREQSPMVFQPSKKGWQQAI
jgi:putative transcriptional regulator